MSLVACAWREVATSFDDSFVVDIECSQAPEDKSLESCESGAVNANGNHLQLQLLGFNAPALSRCSSSTLALDSDPARFSALPAISEDSGLLQ